MAKTDKPYHVHFVCRGNVHRSRLAEAYLRQLDLPGFVVSSSGVEALRYAPHATSRFTELVLKGHPELRRAMSKARTQTTAQLLERADVVVCLDKSVFDDAVRDYGLDPRKAMAWHVEDIDKRLGRTHQSAGDEAAVQGIEHDIFAKIRHECDKLAVYLTHTAWVDVMDARNEPTGLRLPMAWVTDRGLWHRGVHVVAQTVDGKYVVGKRASDIVFAPGMLEISLGGGVDSGEHPLQAAARETHEELGVHMPEKHFRPLFMYKQVGYHPHYHKQTRCHLYVYHVKLPVHSRELRPQPGEVAELRAISRWAVKHLLRAHRLRHFGRLKWGYKLYAKAIAYSEPSV